MSRSSQGFGLVEMLLALALSLVLVLGATRVFMAAKATYLSQGASAYQQEEARFVLGKMLQEIRMAGFAGCLRTVRDASEGGTFSRFAARPVHWNSADQTLSLVTVDVGEGDGAPTWSLVTDCRKVAVVYSGLQKASEGQQVFALRRVFYRFRNQQLMLGTGLEHQQMVLLDNVQAFDISFGLARSVTDSAVSGYSRDPGDPAQIRSVRLNLTLGDPHGAVRPQRFTLVAALRNRLP
ncbi:MAG: PilW family protein [Pseudomonas sp.]|uniref:PilW family protein n=1 Tax=Pseudomonas sp. TaxID=306 RepID=UPI003D112530